MTWVNPNGSRGHDSLPPNVTLRWGKRVNQLFSRVILLSKCGNKIHPALCPR